MSKLILVTGGARSGKSSYAESIAKNFGEDVLYIATSTPFDNEMKARIKKHRESRPDEWKTLEAYKGFERLLPIAIEGKACAMLDCITVMVTNIMFEEEMDFDKVDTKIAEKLEEMVKIEIEKLVHTAKNLDITMIIVTNEVGMGIVPDNPISRVFRDIAGRMNQLLAKASDEVYVCISGMPLRLK